MQPDHIFQNVAARGKTRYSSLGICPWQGAKPLFLTRNASTARGKTFIPHTVPVLALKYSSSLNSAM